MRVAISQQSSCIIMQHPPSSSMPEHPPPLIISHRHSSFSIIRQPSSKSLLNHQASIIIIRSHQVLVKLFRQPYGRHLGGIWEASWRHLEAPGETWKQPPLNKGKLRRLSFGPARLSARLRADPARACLLYTSPSPRDS